MDPASSLLAFVVLILLLAINLGAVLLLSRRLAQRTTRSAGPADLPFSQHVLDALKDDAVSDPDAEQMLQDVFQFRGTIAREVMTPRRDIVALPVTATLAETLRVIAGEGHSRVPVYRETLDEIVGVLLAKDLLAWLADQHAHGPAARPFDLHQLLREPHFVPDTKRIGELLAELKARSVHLAMVLDEFGGTEGLVTLEDVIEEIVGDIYDEFDEPEASAFTPVEGGAVLIDGGASISDCNERLGLDLPERDFDTVGGFVFGELGRIPVVGDRVALNGSGELEVEEVEERRVTRLRFVHHAAGDAAPPPERP